MDLILIMIIISGIGLGYNLSVSMNLGTNKSIILWSILLPVIVYFIVILLSIFVPDIKSVDENLWKFKYGCLLSGIVFFAVQITKNRKENRNSQKQRKGVIISKVLLILDVSAQNIVFILVLFFAYIVMCL